MNKKNILLATIVFVCGLQAYSEVLTGPVAYVVKSVKGTEIDNRCILDLQITGLDSHEGSVVYLYRSEENWVFTDSTQTNHAGIEFPIGHNRFTSSPAGGPSETIDGVYNASTDVLTLKESNSDGLVADIEIREIGNLIKFTRDIYSTSGDPASFFRSEICFLVRL